MFDYKLYFLDSTGHVARAKNLKCAGDSEAVRLVLDHPRICAMELWQDTKLLYTFERENRRTKRLPDYIIYFVQQGHVLGLTTVEAANDDEVFAVAVQIFEACDDICDAYEIWQGNLWLKTGGISLSSTANILRARLAEIENRHQDTVVEREIELLDSYAAIRKSRKLLETVTVLSPQFGRLQ